MTEIFLMETLAAFVEEHTKDIILEVETEPGADRKERPAEVHKYGLPKKDDKIKRIPYVLLQLLKGEDEVEDSECMIRIIAATYSEDWDAGEYDVLNLILRIKAESVSKLMLASAIVSGFGGCLWDGSPGGPVSGWSFLQSQL